MVATELLILGVLNVICILSIISLGLWLRIELANMLELLDERLALALKGTIAVSYTHLTLPTILRV